MAKFQVQRINGQPVGSWKAIYRECLKHERAIVEVRPYDPEKEISIQQMRYLHGVVIPLFVDFTGDSAQYWENKLKLECGSQWFKPEVITIGVQKFVTIPSKKTMSTKDFSNWYQNIRDYGDSIGCPVPPPDSQWRINNDLTT